MACGLRVRQDSVSSTNLVEIYLICYHLRLVRPPEVGCHLRIFMCVCFQLKNIFLYSFYHLVVFWASETLSTSCVYAVSTLLLFCPGKKLKTAYQCAGFTKMTSQKCLDLTLTTSALCISSPHREKILSKLLSLIEF